MLLHELDHGDLRNSAGNTPSGEIRSSCPTAGLGLRPRAGTAVQHYCKEFLCRDQGCHPLNQLLWAYVFLLCSVAKPTYLQPPQTKGKIRNVLFNISPHVKSNLNFPELYISWITGCTLLTPSVYMVESLHYQYFNTLLGKNFGGQPPRAL